MDKKICFNLKAKSTQNYKEHGQLSAEELFSGEKLVCKVIQKHEFHKEYSQLTKGETITKKNKLFQLSPYLDEDGINRIGGRLNKAMEPNIAKHNSVNLLIKSYHDKTLGQWD